MRGLFLLLGFLVLILGVVLAGLSRIPVIGGFFAGYVVYSMWMIVGGAFLVAYSLTGNLIVVVILVIVVAILLWMGGI